MILILTAQIYPKKSIKITFEKISIKTESPQPIPKWKNILITYLVIQILVQQKNRAITPEKQKLIEALSQMARDIDRKAKL